MATKYCSLVKTSPIGTTNKCYIYQIKFANQKKPEAKSVAVAQNDIVVDVRYGTQYKCTKGGTMGGKITIYAAEFTTEANKAATRTPGAVSKLSISRNGLEYTAKWTVPKAWTDQKSAFRPTYASCIWKDINQTTQILQSISTASNTYTLSRSNFYPFANKMKLAGISVTVTSKNSFAEGGKATSTYQFKAPRKPTIDAFTFNTATGVVSTKIKTDEGKDAQERYDTRYSCYVYNAKGQQVAKVADTSDTAKEINVSWNAAGYQSLSYNDYYKIVVKATARGLAGDSAEVTKEYYVSYPARVTVTKVDVSAKTDDGKCTLYINTNSTKEHPVDKVELEYLADCAYADYQDIPGTEEWTRSGIEDDDKCTALAISTQNLIPSAGKYTWVRVKSWHANQDILYRYSTPIRVTQLETPAPTAQDEEITVLSATAVDDTSVSVLLGWNRDGQDDSTGTEISWSDHENTWKSTEDPNSYTFTWSDGQIVHGGVTYQDSANIVIKNLDEGAPVYIKARRYLETEEHTTWSDYSNTFMYIPFGEADNVVAVANQYVPTGESLEVSWTFGSYAYQTAWQIVRTDGLVIASGDGVNSAYNIPADRLAAVAIDGEITFRVEVSTGSEFMPSDEHTVSIVEYPTIEVTAANITAQPYSFGVECSTDANLRVVITSQGVSGVPELNIGRQPEGDTVYSALLQPEWTLADEVNTSTIILPVCDFRDNGTYTISTTAVDTVTGLETTTTNEVTVAWAHQAPDPSATLTPIDEVDEEGNHIQAVQFVLDALDVTTDTYEVYRLTGGAVTLIGEGLSDGTYIDKYAPFGGTFWYRIATRTADGDVAFLDFDYELAGNSLRFDWQGYSLELPYNLAIQDSYTKDVETRQHLDGSTDAYWNSSVMHNASLSSDVIRLFNTSDVELARQLGRYAGAVFVRTPDGSAYEGDVQVRDMSTTGLVHAIAVDATEVNTTGQFQLEEVEDELGA